MMFPVSYESLRLFSVFPPRKATLKKHPPPWGEQIPYPNRRGVQIRDTFRHVLFVWPTRELGGGGVSPCKTAVAPPLLKEKAVRLYQLVPTKTNQPMAT